jgi:hypothetical protein
MKTRVRAIAWVGLLVAATTGCRSRVKDDQVVGELGNGTFRYICVEASDPMCSAGSRASDFPRRIGQNGLFNLEYQPLNTDRTTAVRIISASSEIVDTRNGQFLAVGHGTVALLAKKVENNRVQDIVHLSVVPIDSLRFQGSDGRLPPLFIGTGSRDTLSVVPLDDARTVVAGARDYYWTVDAPERLRLETRSPSATMDIRPIAPGAVTITVTTDGVSATLDLEISGEPVLEPEPGEDGGLPPPTDGGVHVDAGSMSDAGDDPSPGADAAALPDGSPSVDAANDGSPEGAP